MARAAAVKSGAGRHERWWHPRWRRASCGGELWRRVASGEGAACARHAGGRCGCAQQAQAARPCAAMCGHVWPCVARTQPAELVADVDLLLDVERRAWAVKGDGMVKGDGIGGFGGESLEHPRQWLGAQWAGLFLGVPSWGTAMGGALTELRRRATARRRAASCRRSTASRWWAPPPLMTRRPGAGASAGAPGRRRRSPWSSGRPRGGGA